MPTTRKKTNKQKNKDEPDADCELCPEKVTETTDGISCEVCFKWYHYNCVSISEDERAFLNKDEKVHWYCPKSNPLASDIIKTLMKIAKDHEKLSDSVAEFSSTIKNQVIDTLKPLLKDIATKDAKASIKAEFYSEMKKTVTADLKAEIISEIQPTLDSKAGKNDITTLVSEEVKNFKPVIDNQSENQIKVIVEKLNADFKPDINYPELTNTLKNNAMTQINDTIKETINNEQKEVLKGYAKAAAKDLNLPSKPEIQTIINKQVKEDVKEEAYERERIKQRQLNLIVHNLDECEELGDDASKFTEITGEILRIQGVEVESVTRLGTKVTGRHRLLRVTLKDLKHKKEILSRAPQLRQVEEDDPYAKVYIRPDLTPKQLEASKNLYEQLKETREQNPEKQFKIVKGKIQEV